MGLRRVKDKEMREKVRDLIANGWREVEGRRHLRVVSPSGLHTLTVPGTPGDRRALENWLHQVRRIERAEKE